MKILAKFLLLSRGKQIAWVVCLLHCLVVLGLTGHHLFTRRLRPPRPMIVRTIAAPPPQKTTPVAVVKPAPAAPSQPKPTPIAKKAAALASKPAAKKEVPPLKAPPVSHSRPALLIPQKIQSKPESAPSEIDPSYEEFLIAYLQNALELPEYGEVRAKLEINRFGELVQCEILNAKSSKNAEFLKNRLPELTFPCLNDVSHSFTITFRNVEMH